MSLWNGRGAKSALCLLQLGFRQPELLIFLGQLILVVSLDSVQFCCKMVVVLRKPRLPIFKELLCIRQNILARLQVILSLIIVRLCFC